mgnify:CR=1 FL=1
MGSCPYILIHSEILKYILVLSSFISYMAKRPTGLKKRTKSRHSPKTKKRLAAKREMLAKKAARRKKR